MWFELIVLPAE